MNDNWEAEYRDKFIQYRMTDLGGGVSGPMPFWKPDSNPLSAVNFIRDLIAREREDAVSEYQLKMMGKS